MPSGTSVRIGATMSSKTVKADRCNASVMRELLRMKFDDHRRYAVAEEVGNQTGFQKRRLDMVVVDVYESNGYSVEGIEIKVSKSDLRKELQDSSKHNIFFDDLDYYSLAAPLEIIDKDIIPKHWGIYAAILGDDGGWYLRTIRKPLSLHDKQVETIGRGFFACLSRAIACQSPTASKLNQAERRGIEKGIEQERNNRSWRAREVDKKLERLNELERLFEHCQLWGDGSVEKGISKFEAFMQIGEIDWIARKLETANKDLAHSIKMLNTIQAAGESVGQTKGQL